MFHGMILETPYVYIGPIVVRLTGRSGCLTSTVEQTILNQFDEMEGKVYNTFE